MTIDSADPESPTPPATRENGSSQVISRAACGLLLVAIACGLAFYVMRRARTVPQPPQVATEELDPAVAAVLKQRYDDVRKYPRTGAAWGWLGTALMAYDFKSEARECYVQAEKLEPTDPRWPYFHGLSMFPDEKDEGLERLRRAVDLTRDESPAASNRLGKILTALGELDEAELHFRRVQQRWQNDPDAILGLGTVAFLRGDLPASLELVNRASTSPHTARAAQQMLAKIHHRQGDEEAARLAIAEMQRLPEDIPTKDPFVDEAAMVWTGRQAWLEHAARLYRQDRIDEALPLAERTVGVYPEAPEAWAMLARLKMRSKDFSAARSAWEKTIELAPEDLEGHLQLGLTLLQLREFEDAVREFKQAIALKPDLSEGHHNLGLTLISVQRPAEAIPVFREAIRLQPTNFDSYLGLADALRRTGDEEGARQTLDKAIEVRPNDPRAQKLREQL